MTASFERIKDRFGTADLPKLPVSRRPAGQPVQLDHQWDSQRQTCHEADENAGPAMGVESQPLLLSRPADKWHEVFKSAIQVTGKTMIRESGLPFRSEENAGPAMGVESQPLLLSRPADKWHEVFKSAIQVTGKTMIRESGLPF